MDHELSYDGEARATRPKINNSGEIPMKRSNTNLITVLLTAFLLLLTAHSAQAAEKIHKLVIQVSTDDVRTQNIAMNNAVNLQKALGQDNIIIEIVAYGPGLSMLTPKSPASKRVPSLAMQDITFSACGNTKAKVEEKTGKPVNLVEGVQIVQAGVLRIMELQEQGYAYIRP
jgi:intracellular sulfur oxidation DsrE/DsrF family protein